MTTDEQIAAHIAAKKSFLLDAGAGAGKTSALVESLRKATKGLGQEMARRGQHIACITYTNVAKDEIIERTGHSDLIRVATIHDFLWSVLKGHQQALRRALIQVNTELPVESRVRKEPEQLSAALPSLSITYSDTGSNFLEGRIFHDDLIKIAKVMFATNPLLAKLVAAEYPYIFIDEYQDANALVVEVLVDHILANNAGKVVIGFFGDKLQHIYDSGVGELPETARARLEHVVKSENYRCSLAVIQLLNRLRRDIKQVPGPKNLPGQAVYVQVGTADASSIQRVRAMLVEKYGWKSSDGTERELYLTHKLIARKGGYDGLIDAYDKRGGMSRERMLGGEDSRMKFLVESVEVLGAAWAARNAGLAIAIMQRDGKFVLSAEQTKAKAAAALDRLNALRASDTVAAVLRHLLDTKLLKDKFPDDLRDRLAGKVPVISDTPEAKEREERDVAFYTALFALPYAQVASFAAFFQQHTAYATKHGVKGAEFDTVYVVLDDKGARWNIYSFERFLSGEDVTGNPERFRRTRNVFYVCCSRARQNLAVIDLGGTSPRKKAAVEEVFGAENCLAL